MAFLVSVILSLFFLLGHSHGQLSDNAFSSSTNDLASFLSNLHILLPPFNDSTLQNASCDSLNVVSLASDVVGSSFGLSISFGVSSCSLYFNDTTAKPPKSHLVSFSLSPAVLDLTFFLNISDSDYLLYMTTTTCELALNLDNVKIVPPSLSIDLIIQAINKAFNGSMCAVVQDLLVQKLINPFLFNATSEIQLYANISSNNVIPSPPDWALNLFDATALDVVSFFVDLIGANINWLVDAFTKNTGAIDISNFSIPLPPNPVANLSLNNPSIRISGLDTFDNSSLFDLIDPSVIMTQIGVKKLAIEVKLDLTLQLNNATDPIILEESLLVAIDLTDFYLRLDLLAWVNKSQHDYFQSMNPLCVTQSLAMLKVGNFLLDAPGTKLNVSFLSTDFVELQVNELINNLTNSIIAEFAVVLPDVLGLYVFSPLVSVLNEELESLVATGNQIPCIPVLPSNSSSSSSFWSSEHIGTVVGYSGAFLIFLVVFVYFMSQESRIRARTYSPNSLQHDDYHHVNSSRPLLQCANENGLILNMNLNPVIRYGIPLVICATIGTFLSSNTSDAANVDIIQYIGNTTEIKLPPMFSFSLANSIRDMYNAKVYFLSFAIAFCSGTWPYLKLLLMLFCWCAPIRTLKESTREKIMHSVDVLGKWSLLDNFVLILMSVGFRMTISTQETTTDIVVNAYMGFYTFLLATVLSLIVGHIILGIHRHTAIRTYDELTEESQFSKYNPSGKRRLFNSILLTFTLGLMLAGTFLHSFYFHLKGAVGLVLEWTNFPTSTDYSLYSLGLNFPESNSSPNGFGIRLIQAVFFTFAMVIPLLHVFAMLIRQIFMIHSPRFSHILDTLNAWSAMEVFAVSILAALLQVHQFAMFIIGDKCNGVDSFLEQYFGSLLDGDYHCFDVRSSVNPLGISFLLAGVVCHMLCRNLIH